MPSTEESGVARDATVLRLPSYEDLRTRGVFSTEVERLRAENLALRDRLASERKARGDALELIAIALRLLGRV